MNAVLFRSTARFDSFHRVLTESGVITTVLDFATPEWTDFDFSKTDILIYFPTFTFSSNHPLALYPVYDNMMHIYRMNPHLCMFPDPKVIPFYSDKYRQWLFLRGMKLPHPETLPMWTEASLPRIADQLGFPLVVKNRYGAGGDFVFKVSSSRELLHYFRLSQLDLFRWTSIPHFLGKLTSRLFYYYLLRRRQMQYPFMSPPLLAQKFVPHDRDIKTVLRSGKVIEAHWRSKAEQTMWKVNIDGGGIGEWSFVPQEVIDLSQTLARHLGATWLNVDILKDSDRYVITEFSPVWHHYAYKEKPTFIYKDDYNIDIPLEVSLDLERLIVDSLIVAAKSRIQVIARPGK